MLVKGRHMFKVVSCDKLHFQMSNQGIPAFQDNKFFYQMTEIHIYQPIAWRKGLFLVLLLMLQVSHTYYTQAFQASSHT